MNVFNLARMLRIICPDSSTGRMSAAGAGGR